MRLDLASSGLRWSHMVVFKGFSLPMCGAKERKNTASIQGYQLPFPACNDGFAGHQNDEDVIHQMTVGRIVMRRMQAKGGALSSRKPAPQYRWLSGPQGFFRNHCHQLLRFQREPEAGNLAHITTG